MNTEIKTGWDLKLALEKIITVIDERQGLFSEVEESEKHAIDRFSKSLAERRDSMVKAMKDHYDAMERDVYPWMDKLDTVRQRLNGIDMKDIPNRLPQIWQLKDFAALVEIMERFSRLDQTAWNRLMQLAEAGKAPEPQAVTGF